MTLDVGVQKRRVLTLRHQRQQCLQCVLYVAYHTEIHRMAATDVHRIEIDLNDGCVLGVELLPREVRTE